MIQLGMALLVVGFLIWVSALIKRTTGNPTDLLGVGLTGEFGLLVYLVLLALVAAGIYMAYRAVVTGKAWVAPRYIDLQQFHADREKKSASYRRGRSDGAAVGAAKREGRREPQWRVDDYVEDQIAEDIVSPNGGPSM